MGQCEPEQVCGRVCKRSIVGYCLILSLIAVIFVLVATAFEGRFGLEKSLTGLVLPVGFLWLNLSTITLQSWIGKWSSSWRYGLVAGWLVTTSITTAPLPDLLFAQFERQLKGEFKPGVDQPLDVVVVFGGGTKLGPNRPEVADAGDRLVYGAQLYHCGHAHHLLATGEGADVQTVVIWRDLAIPAERISTIEGRNTFEEINNLVEWLKEYRNSTGADRALRVGILSSAYHLPRIQRLADKAGLRDLIPVAANHKLSPDSYTVLDFVPSIGSLARFADVQREIMGRLVGR